jgi:hypothetical protein
MSRDTKYYHPHWIFEESMHSITSVSVESLLEFEEPIGPSKRVTVPRVEGAQRWSGNDGRRNVALTSIAVPPRLQGLGHASAMQGAVDEALFEGFWRELGLPHSLDA